jgi:AraC-like DNA-binding protein
MDKSAMVLYYFYMSDRLGLFFDAEVQRLIDSFAACFHVRITFFSVDMKELLVGLQNPISPFCRAVQKDLQLRHRCLAQDQMMCQQSQQQAGIVSYQCHGGLNEAVVPIIVKNEILGYAMLGQFRTTEEVDPEILHLWKMSGRAETDLKLLFNQQPLYDQNTRDGMFRLFSMMVSFIISRDFVRILRPTLVEKISLYIDAHIDKAVTLKEVAEHFNKSPSTISHILKSQLGISFKQLCIIKKIQRFESLLRADPTIPIKTAVHELGYDDPLYFSRLYKKYRFVPPSIYIQSLH